MAANWLARQQHLSSMDSFLRTGHPPEPQTTDGEAANPGPRLRRRGPRSAEARERRLQRSIDRARSGNNGPQEHQDEADEEWRWTDELFTIWQVNVQGLFSHMDELTARVRTASPVPQIICVNEYFLDKAVGEVKFEGFATIARRDRQGGRKGGSGGVAGGGGSHLGGLWGGGGTPGHSPDAPGSQMHGFLNKKHRFLKDLALPATPWTPRAPKCMVFLIKNIGFQRIWHSRPLPGRPGLPNAWIS